MIRVMGVDVGYALPGLCVVEVDGTTLKSLLHAEGFKTKGLTTKQRRTGGVTTIYKSADDARRMLEISDRIAEIVEKFQPDLAVLELPTAGAKSASAIKAMALASATAVVTFRRLGVEQAYITPRQNKWGSTQDKDAQKVAVHVAAKRLFPDFKWPLKKKGNLDKETAWAISDAISCVSTWASVFNRQLAAPTRSPQATRLSLPSELELTSPELQ
jgi:Holliday junction resolvasome RuvABC endonuclease subunit